MLQSSSNTYGPHNLDFFSRLPDYVFINIISYTNWQETLSSLQKVNHSLHKKIASQSFLKDIISRLVTMKSLHLEKRLENASLKDLLKFIGSNKNNSIQELPFWGYKSNAGIYQNIYNYWIEKAFTKSRQQMVSYKKRENVHIEGALATDILIFKEIMKEMSEKLNGYIDFYKMNMKKYPTDYPQINIDQIFYQYYESSQLSLYLNETGKKFWNHFLIYDSLIENALEKDELNILQKYKEIKGYFANIHEIHIHRAGGFSRPMKTMMLFYKLEEKDSTKTQTKGGRQVRKTRKFESDQTDQTIQMQGNHPTINQSFAQQSDNRTVNSHINIHHINQNNLLYNNTQSNPSLLNQHRQSQSVQYQQNSQVIYGSQETKDDSQAHLLNLLKLDIVQLFDDCKSQEQLNNLCSKYKEIIPKVKTSVVKKSYRYSLFQRNDSVTSGLTSKYQPILWLQFNDFSVKNLKIALSETLKISCNKIMLKIIDHTEESFQFIDDIKDQTFQEPIHGPGFGYVSFQGELVNQKFITQSGKKRSKTVVPKAKNKLKPKKSLK